jgi:hypothetical protein
MITLTRSPVLRKPLHVPSSGVLLEGVWIMDRLLQGFRDEYSLSAS